MRRYHVKLFKQGELHPYFVGVLSTTKPAVVTTEEMAAKLRQAEIEWICKIEQVLNNSPIGRCHISEAESEER